MEPYEYLEHTADVKFRAHGASPEEMFENAALAMLNAMVETSSVRERETWKMDLAAEDLEQLLYNWLSELLYLSEVESVVFSSFRVDLSQGEGTWSLKARIGGEKIDLARHAFENEVKAVTLHQFRIERDEFWAAQVSWTCR